MKRNSVWLMLVVSGCIAVMRSDPVQVERWASFEWEQEASLSGGLMPYPTEPWWNRKNCGSLVVQS